MAKMGKIERFEDLIAWQKSKKLSLLIYEESSRGDFSRDFALRVQVRRATVSMMSNIAERYWEAFAGHFVKSNNLLW